VDPFSGRVMVGRRWSDGMHQSIEAKEGEHPRERERHYSNIQDEIDLHGCNYERKGACEDSVKESSMC